MSRRFTVTGYRLSGFPVGGRNFLVTEVLALKEYVAELIGLGCARIEIRAL